MDYQNYPRNDILCIDMRSFYASVEAVRLGLDPLKAMLAVVGDLSRPGSIVLAASPTLKEKYGLQNVSRFYELPNDSAIHIVQANMADYLKASINITKLIHSYAPKEAIHQYSIDEVWVTVNGLEKLFGKRWEIAKKIKDDILEQFGLPAVVGIGDNKFLAKVIMDLEAKKVPTGIAECRYEDVAEKLWPFPVGAIWGIGKQLEKQLNRLGIVTLGEIAQFPLLQLQQHFGIIGQQLYAHAWGIDLSPVFGDFTNHRQESFGHGITLLRDYTKEEARICMLDLCEEVCRRARADKSAATTVHLSIGYAFQAGGFNRSKSITIPTNITREVYRVCLTLFNTFYDGDSKIRRVNVTLTNLVPDSETQLDLFSERVKEKEIGYVMDAIRNRFGETAILRASSYTDAGIALDRSKKLGGHKA